MTRTSAVSSTLRRRLARPSLAQWTALALAVFGAAVTFVAYRDYVMEDAYITYRYAQNLAAGNGFVFNPGERVLGTSTPLYAMVLGLAGLLGLDIAAHLRRVVLGIAGGDRAARRRHPATLRSPGSLDPVRHASRSGAPATSTSSSGWRSRSI